MRKVVCGVMFSCCLNLFGMNVDQIKLESENFGFSRVAMLDHNGDAIKVSYDYTLDADNANIKYMVSQQFMPGEAFRGIMHDRDGHSYPCTKSFVGFESLDDSHSLAVYKLTVDIDKLKGVVLDEHFVDSEHPLEHHEVQILNYIDGILNGTRVACANVNGCARVIKVIDHICMPCALITTYDLQERSSDGRVKNGKLMQLLGEDGKTYMIPTINININ